MSEFKPFGRTETDPPAPNGRPRLRATLVPLFLVFVCASCAVGPRYERPAALGTNAAPAAFAERPLPALGDWKVATPAAHLPRGQWWELFNDAELSRLETLATESNQDLAEAAAHLEQARALVKVARSDLYPHLSADPSATRQRTSVNAFDRGHAAGVTHTYNSFSLPLDASWEIDFWGRLRAQTEGARARLAATADDYQSARLGVQAEVAFNYFGLRSLDAESAILEENVIAFRRALELTRNRRQGGIVSDLDVSQAETQLQSTEAQIPVVTLQRSKLQHALATLCGHSATLFSLGSSNFSRAPLPAVPAVVPSDVLEHRPDIAAAERRMAAANTDIGIAQSAFYPRVLFKGTAGLQSIDAGTLWNWPSHVWALGPAVEWPLFTGGRNRALLASSRAAYDASVAGYRGVVLRAFQEVEDQLAATRLLDATLSGEVAALSSARRTLTIANNRYLAGVVTYLEVATAQSAALVHERTVVQLRTELLTAHVALIKALGAPWQQRAQSVSSSVP